MMLNKIVYEYNYIVRDFIERNLLRVRNYMNINNKYNVIRYKKKIIVLYNILAERGSSKIYDAILTIKHF